MLGALVSPPESMEGRRRGTASSEARTRSFLDREYDCAEKGEADAVREAAPAISSPTTSQE